MASKKCTVCGKEKQLSEYRARKDVQGGHRAQCKECMNRAEKVARERREGAR